MRYLFGNDVFKFPGDRIVRTHYRRLGFCFLLTLLATSLGMTRGADAIDRYNFRERPVSDAYPGYGAESSGYGAEQKYYGAEGLIPDRSTYRRDSYGLPNDFYGNDDYDRRFLSDRDTSVYYIPNAGYASDGYDDFNNGGNGGSGSFVYYGYGSRSASVGRLGPKIIDVATQGLNRAPLGRSGINIRYAGTTKFISVSPNYGRTKPNGSGRRAILEPWTERWSRHCSRAHSSFNAKRGTYIGADRRERFCTGE